MTGVLISIMASWITAIPSICIYFLWQSKFNFSNSYYNFAQNTSEFYQKQEIESVGLGLNYNIKSFVDKIGVSINYSEATGTNKYHQNGLNFYTKFILKEKIYFNFTYNYNNKYQTSQKYNNSTFRANLSYRF